LKVLLLTSLALALSLSVSLVAPSLAIATNLEDPSRLDGEWRLDWDRSDSFEPVMKALEVSWLLRKLAGVARVGLELRAVPLAEDCGACVREMLVTLKSPLSDAEVRIFLDGVARPGKDPRGRDTLDAYTWTKAGSLEMDREVELPSGKQARLLETRSIDSDPNTLNSTLVVWVDGIKQASITRAFERQSD
jgi:hypothetical protein